MTSNDDLMKFLERMEEKREKEKLELVERMEDMKKEVKGAVKSVSDRQDKMEVEQEHIKNDIGVLKSQMEEIKKLVQEPVVQSQGEQHHQEGTQQHQLHVEPGTKSYSKVVEFSAQKKLLEYLPSEVSERQKALDLLDLGRRTVSLHPLQLKDCELEIKRGAKDQNEAKLWAAQTYLRYEMNIKSHILATFTIEDIFVLSESYDTMYVTFSSSTEANTENIQQMRKETWKNMVRTAIQQKTFKKLENMKLTHSKVKNLKYIRLEMQEYLKPHNIKDINKEITQNIFRIRSKVLNVKMNRKNQYETFECKVCLVEDESQEHVYECRKIWELKQKNNMEVPKYEEILWGKASEMIEVEKILRENMKILEEYEQKPS